MKKYHIACLAGVFALGCAHAGVVGIDFSTDSDDGPGPDMLPGVIGKTTTDVIWNTVDSTELKVGLVDENGLATGASFQFGSESDVLFASLASDATQETGFFRSYAHLSAGGEEAFTNSFTISGIESTTADLVFYATWGWATAGSEFRVSSDGGTSWSDWVLCDGGVNKGEAPFTEGVSYITIDDVGVHTNGTIIGEWMTTTNGASIAQRGPFNAIQIDSSDYADALAPAFISDSFSIASLTEGVAISGNLSDYLVSEGSQYVISSLTDSSWFSVASDGTMSGTPAHSDAGDNVIEVKVIDDQGQFDTATLTLIVDPVYDRYIDTFDGDGLGINTNYGGGLVAQVYSSYTIDVTDDSEDLEFVGGLGSNEGAQHGGAYTLQKFPVTQGFTLDVTYTIEAVPGTLSESIGIGLVDDPESISSLLYSATVNEAIGVSLTERNGNQGLNHCTFTDGETAGVLTSLSNAQVITAGSNCTFNLTVEQDGSYSYSIDGATPTTGTTTFDLSKEYHFAVYSQRPTTEISIQSVSFIPIQIVNSVGNVSMEVVGGVPNFSWYGESRGLYELQSRDDLAVGGEEAWQTISTISGGDTEISVPVDVDGSQKFFRVKLNEDDQ